jgi:O-antigen ligase
MGKLKSFLHSPIVISLLSYLFVFSLFYSPSKQNFLSWFDLYWYYPLYALLILFGLLLHGKKQFAKIKNFTFSAFFHNIKYQILSGQINGLLWFFSFLILSLFSMFLWPYPFTAFAKQVIGFVFFSLAWSSFFRFVSFQRAIQTYLVVAFIAALFTIPEQILHLNGIHITPKKGAWLGLYRCFSFTDEPFSLALLLLPAIFWKIQTWQNFSLKKIFTVVVLLVGLLFTFSGAGWLAFGFALFAIALYSSKALVKWALVSGIVLLFVGFFSYHGTRLRITETVSLFRHFPDLPRETVLNATNSSSRAIYLNAIVAAKQIQKNPLSGGGLGSHKHAYKDFIETPLKNRKEATVHYNQADAASGILRALSEMGLFGLAFFVFLFWTLRKYLIYQRAGMGAYWLAFLLHGGNYFLHGPFFWYFVSNKKAEGLS